LKIWFSIGSRDGGKMAQNISWTYSADNSGGGINASGSTIVDAVISASVDLDAAMAQKKDLALQVDDVSKVAFLVIASSLYDGKVEIQATGTNPTALAGPLILYGAAVGLFASDLTTLKVQNKSAQTAATLSILIGLTVAA
jgi:hypothetical protein